MAGERAVFVWWEDLGEVRTDNGWDVALACCMRCSTVRAVISFAGKAEYTKTPPSCPACEYDGSEEP